MRTLKRWTGDCAPYLLRDPSLSGTHLAFAYGGNIWAASRSGGDPRRLTSAGRESKPVISPRGKQVAFIGEYGGSRGVFVMPIEGGEPRRVTHHPDDCGGGGFSRTGDTLCWTPDGKRILFSSRRAAFAGGTFPVIQLFTVPAEGGCATQVPLVRAAQGVFSPDATRIAYVPHIRVQPEWKNYRGGQTTPIWVADLATSSVVARIPRDNSNDFNPMWLGDTIYFLSDRSGPVTLFSYEVKSGKVQQLVRNDGFDIKSAFAGPDAIVYEKFGSLHLFDLMSGEDRVLDVRPTADFPEVRPRFRNLGDVIGKDAFAPEVKPMLSPTGGHAAFGVRGEILTVSATNGDIRNLTQTPGAVERDPAWSPDGKCIAYFSDESSEYALHIRECSGLERVRKIDLGPAPNFYYSPAWSPDSSKIAYVDKCLNYWYVDLDRGTPTLIDTDSYVDPPRINLLQNAIGQVAWSPDSRWIAYTKVMDNHLHAVFIHSLEHGKSYQLTDGMADALYVAFDKGGDYLYFTMSTDVGLGGDFMAMSSFRRPLSRSVYGLALRRGAPNLLGSQAEEEGVSTAVPRAAKFEVDLEGADQRISRLPVPPANYAGLFAGGSNILFLVEEAQVDQWGSRRRQSVHRFDVGAQRVERILQDVIYFDLSFDGKMMLHARGAPSQKRHWFITSAQAPVNAAVQPIQGMLRLDSIPIHVDPRLEWKHLYAQAWRGQRDFFYDPELHGLDLDEAKKAYAPFLDNISSRDDLDYLLAEMLGNLSVGHMWVASPDASRERPKTGLLGADYTVEGGRYRFTRIYKGDVLNPAARAPLCEPGAGVQVGEYLLAVNDRDVRPSAEVFSYFEETAGKRVTLTVGPEADGSRSRKVVVVPVDDEYPLRYFSWVEGNRRKVDELTGGRVAYVHVPDCRLSGYAAFNRYFFAQVGKGAAIIDARYNNGGQMPDYIIDCLRRDPLCYWHPREGRDLCEPSLGIFGPKVMLINEMAISMGDVLAWAFRRAGIGPLIGKRTWGGAVGAYAHPADALDSSLLYTPNLAFYTPEGVWGIENVGVPPDVEVDDDPKAARSGHDTQLEKAIEVVAGLLKTSPGPAAPRRPAYPNYHRES